jgi:hypothetical protein
MELYFLVEVHQEQLPFLMALEPMLRLALPEELLLVLQALFILPTLATTAFES